MMKSKKLKIELKKKSDQDSCENVNQVFETIENNEMDIEQDMPPEKDFDFLVDHNYCLVSKRSQDPLGCSDCGYVAKRMSHLKTHKKLHCKFICERKKLALRTSTCPICGKKYTHDGLRSHLRNYLSENRVFRGEHSTYSVDQHQQILNNVVFIKAVN